MFSFFQSIIFKLLHFFLKINSLLQSTPFFINLYYKYYLNLPPNLFLLSLTYMRLNLNSLFLLFLSIPYRIIEIPKRRNSIENQGICFLFYNNSKMMEIQAQNTHDLITKMKNAASFNQHQSFYRQNSKSFSEIIKCQKNKFTYGFQHQNSHFIVQLVKLIFCLFEKSQCRSLYPDLIVLLNNIFNLDNQYMEEFLFDQCILINLRKYFQWFCKHYQIEKEKLEISKIQLSRLNFQLYSMIYFIAMLICQNNKKQVHSSLKKIFFTNSFINNFLTLEIEISKKNQIYKLISIIVVFLVKKIDLSAWYSKIKSFILSHINKVTQKKSQFNFVYCLRTINMQYSFQSHQLKKFQIIHFLVDNLNLFIHQYHLTYTLDLIRLILKKHPILGYKFINSGLLDHLLNNFQSQPNLVTCVLEQLKDSIQGETKAQLYQFFEQRLSNTNLQKYALKCLIMFYPFRDINKMIKSFQKGLLDRISDLIKKQENPRMWELGFSFLQVVLQDITKKSKYLHGHIVSKIETLQIIEFTQNSNNPILKEIGNRFKRSFLPQF